MAPIRDIQLFIYGVEKEADIERLFLRIKN